MSGAAARMMTVEEFEQLPVNEGLKLELIEGEVFEVASGGPLHETVKSNFIHILVLYCHAMLATARVTSETRYRLHSTSMPQPDVSLVLAGDLDPERSGKIQITPDIAVEVVSSESGLHLRKKIRTYLSAGVKAVWVAYPELGLIDVHTPEGVRRLESDDILEDGVLPGFAVPVADFFRGI